jgi:FkbM family methyltransferase
MPTAMQRDTDAVLETMKKAVRRRDAVLKTSYSDRQFHMVGSETDISVLGPIADNSGWEPHIMNLMKQIVRPTDICLDIGANIGALTLVLSDLAADGKVFAFEPSSINYHFLAENIRNNGFQATVCEQIGLGQFEEQKEFTHLVGMEGCSFVNPDKSIEELLKTAWGSDLERITEAVSIKTLDGWAKDKKIDRVDFIKMDVEGFELAVIEGGAKIFDQKPSLIVELNRNTLSMYQGVNPADFFAKLASIYPFIYLIHVDVEKPPEAVTSFSQIEPLLELPLHWWVDLLCLPNDILEYRRPDRAAQMPQ